MILFIKLRASETELTTEPRKQCNPVNSGREYPKLILLTPKSRISTMSHSLRRKILHEAFEQQEQSLGVPRWTAENNKRRRIEEIEFNRVVDDARSEIDFIEERFRLDLALHLYSTFLLHQETPHFPDRYWAGWPQPASRALKPRHQDIYVDEVHVTGPPRPAVAFPPGHSGEDDLLAVSGLQFELNAVYRMEISRAVRENNRQQLQLLKEKLQSSQELDQLQYRLLDVVVEPVPRMFPAQQKRVIRLLRRVLQTLFRSPSLQARVAPENGMFDLLAHRQLDWIDVVNAVALLLSSNSSDREILDRIVARCVALFTGREAQQRSEKCALTGVYKQMNVAGRAGVNEYLAKDVPGEKLQSVAQHRLIRDELAELKRRTFLRVAALRLGFEG